jgi:hypothetical protein
MNIKELAQQASLCYTLGNYDDWIDAGPAGDELKRFAELVAAHEREECARMCEDTKQEYESLGHERELKYTCADAIRARSKA